MTSRERVARALSHKPTDRLPIDFGGTRQTGISVWAYVRLRERLGGNPGYIPRIFDTYQMLAEIEPWVAERLGSDCVGLYRPAVAFGLENRNWKKFVFPDGLIAEVPEDFNPEQESEGGLVLKSNGIEIASMPAGGFYFDRLEKNPGALHPNLSKWDAPRISPETLDHYSREAHTLFETTDKAIVAPLGPPYELFYGLGQGGFEDWMVTFALEDEYVTELYGKIVDAWLENLAAFRKAVGDCVQVIQVCDDFGTQNAPFLSTPLFRKRLLRAYKRGLDWIHANTSWKVLLHSDGAIFPLLPSIIEMGIDSLNPVQTSASGMDPLLLKQSFGEQLSFWGGSCDGQSTLTHGTPDQVADETARNAAALQRGGGYVCASIHNIQANVPADNIIALFDTAKHLKLTS